MQSKGITRDNLKNFSKEEMIEVCILLANTEDIRVIGLRGYAKQLRDMGIFLNEESIVQQIRDKDDKGWDRGHKLMEKFEEYQSNLLEMENKFLPEHKEKVSTLSASKKSILSLDKD